MRYQYNGISQKIIKQTKSQMKIDQCLMRENKFRAENVHRVKKNMNKNSYFGIYTRFISAQFKEEWDRKGAHHGGWESGRSLVMYRAKLHRFVMIRCYNFLMRERDEFFQRQQ